MFLQVPEVIKQNQSWDDFIVCTEASSKCKCVRVTVFPSCQMLSRHKASSCGLEVTVSLACFPYGPAEVVFTTPFFPFHSMVCDCDVCACGQVKLAFLIWQLVTAITIIRRDNGGVKRAAPVSARWFNFSCEHQTQLTSAGRMQRTTRMDGSALVFQEKLLGSIWSVFSLHSQGGNPHLI